jgi:hypothetical protein
MNDCNEYERCGCEGTDFDLHCMMCCDNLEDHPRWVRQALWDRYSVYRARFLVWLYGTEVWEGVGTGEVKHYILGGLFNDW